MRRAAPLPRQGPTQTRPPRRVRQLFIPLTTCTNKQLQKNLLSFRKKQIIFICFQSRLLSKDSSIFSPRQRLNYAVLCEVDHSSAGGGRVSVTSSGSAAIVAVRLGALSHVAGQPFARFHYYIFLTCIAKLGHLVRQHCYLICHDVSINKV